MKEGLMLKKRVTALILAAMMLVVMLMGMSSFAAASASKIRVKGGEDTIRLYKNNKLVRTVSVDGPVFLSVYKGNSGYVVMFDDDDGDTRKYIMGKNCAFTLSGDYEAVELEKSFGSAKVSVSSDCSIDELLVASNANVTLYGDVNDVEATGKAKVNVRSGSYVQRLYLASGASARVYKNGTVESLERVRGSSVKNSGKIGSSEYVDELDYDDDDDDVIDIGDEKPSTPSKPTTPSYTNKVAGVVATGSLDPGGWLMASASYSNGYGGSANFSWYVCDVYAYGYYSRATLVGSGTYLRITDEMSGKYIICEATGTGSTTGMAQSRLYGPVGYAEVQLGAGSAGVAGKGVITGLTDGQRYMVSVRSMYTGRTNSYSVTAAGLLALPSDTAYSNSAALASGGKITLSGSTAGNVYTVVQLRKTGNDLLTLSFDSGVGSVGVGSSMTISNLPRSLANAPINITFTVSDGATLKVGSTDLTTNGAFTAHQSADFSSKTVTLTVTSESGVSKNYTLTFNYAAS